MALVGQSWHNCWPNVPFRRLLNEPTCSFRPHSGPWPGRSRNLTAEEAQEAMGIILRGECAPEAVGGLLMLMRYRGEEPQEIEGFVRAFRATLPEWQG